MGRPSDYSEELAAEIAARLLESTTLKNVCEAEDMPSLRTVMRWSALHPEFQQMLDRARVDKADHVLEEAIEISNEPVSDNAQASRQRTRVDARLKIAAKLNPAKYAERLATGQAPELPQKTETDPLELARGLAFLLQKGAQVAMPESGEPLRLTHAPKQPEPPPDPEPQRPAVEVFDAEEVLRKHRLEVEEERRLFGSADEQGLDRRNRFTPPFRVLNRRPS